MPDRMCAGPPNRTSLAGALLLPFLALGCSDGASLLEPSFDEERQLYVVELTVGPLVQTIELSHTNPVPGDVLEVRSVVTNTGAPRVVETRICGLDLRGVTLEPHGVSCTGYSRRETLATGGSVASGQTGIVRARPGTHRLRIRHLLDPERWVEVEIRVR